MGTMKPMKTVFVTFFAFAILASSIPAKAIESHLLDYRIELHFGWPLSGKISQRLRSVGNNIWQIERNGVVFGFTAREVSKFRMLDSAIESILYLKEQSGLRKDSNLEIDFNVSGRGSYDPISLAVKIGLDLRNDPDLKTKVYRLSTKQGKVRDITFTFTPGQVLDTGIGDVNTVRVDQVTDSDSSRTYWLGVDLDYIIIRAIERDEDGDIKTEINIKNGSIGGVPIKSRKK